MKIGTKEIESIFAGSTQIKKVCIGTKIIYEVSDDHNILVSGTTKSNTNFMVKVNGTDRAAVITGSAGSNLYYFEVYDDGTAITSLANFAKGNTNIVSCQFMPVVHAQTCMFTSAFYGCTSLTEAPALPATTLANNCYKEMFNGCTSLTIAPELPAKSSATYSYTEMFRGCTNLNYIKAMCKSPVARNFNNWVRSVAATGTFVKNAEATWSNGISGIPTGWTVEDAE